MESKINYTAVGAFVILLIGAIIFAILWLSSSLNSSDKYLPYHVYMNEPVNGLSVDSTVKYNGVEVGTVKSIELNTKNPQQVILLLDIKVDTPITVDTVATLDRQGLTGIASLALKNGGTSTQPLRALPGQPYPVIKTAPSLFVRLDTALTQLTTNLNQVSAKISTTLDAENQQALKQTLKNLDALTKQLSTASQQLPALLQTTQSTLNNLNRATNSVTDVSNEIKQNPSMLIRGKTPQALGPGEK